MRKIIIPAVLAMLGASIMAVHPAWAEPSWAQLPPSQFPAFVKAIEFPSGNKINESSGMCWGNWCVNFGSKRPSAKKPQCSPNCTVIWIDELVCRNPVVGEKACRIELGHSAYHLRCKVYPNIKAQGIDKSVGKFEIDCPRVLRF